MDLPGEYLDLVYRTDKGLPGMKREINVVKPEEIDNPFESYINLLSDLHPGLWNRRPGIVAHQVGSKHV